MKPLVTICCVTYNHEKYIADALDSFLRQEATFPFEIIVHDDASTDNTAEIIRDYEKKNPGIIKPIYQKENQYSKGKNPLKDFIIPLAKGKYIATCEGDDFWIDEYKLEKQVRFLENNQDYIMCFHRVKVIDTDKKFLGRYLGLKQEKRDKKINIMEAATGGVVHVSSRLMRTDFNKKQRPSWIKNARHGDYATALYMAAEGKVYYISEVMSAYRTGVEYSMMTNFRNNYSKENDIEYQKNRIETLMMADEYYNLKHHKEIERVNLTSKVIIELLESNFFDSLNTNSRKYIAENGLVAFLKLFLLKKCPRSFSFLIKIKSKLLIMINRRNQ